MLIETQIPEITYRVRLYFTVLFKDCSPMFYKELDLPFIPQIGMGFYASNSQDDQFAGIVHRVEVYLPNIDRAYKFEIELRGVKPDHDQMVETFTRSWSEYGWRRI